MREKKELKRSIWISLILLAVLFALPLAVIVPWRGESEPEPFQPGKRDQEIVLRVLDQGQVREMNMGEYLVGVVRAEMPASFALEALKAQATAARTYTLYKMETGGNHGDQADICTDFTCCQAYLSQEQARANWGRKAEENEEKIRRAVRETDGMTIRYGDAPILAVFHSSSAGRTRNSGDVWVNDLPYLQSVDSPEDREHIPNYTSRVEVSAAEFREKVLKGHPEARLEGSPEGWIKNPVTDSAGSVETLNVGGVELRGAELRSLLGLRSACFEWEVKGDHITFFVRGFGHGVGMSQYGANRMAEEGADYQEILTHYYTGVTIAPASPVP